MCTTNRPTLRKGYRNILAISRKLLKKWVMLTITKGQC